MPVGPAPSAELLAPTEVATLIQRTAGTVRKHLRDGALHGHVTFGLWVVRVAAAEAFAAGLAPSAQQHACACDTNPIESDDEVLTRKRREFLEAAGPPSPERIARLRQIFRESDRRRAAQ